MAYVIKIDHKGLNKKTQRAFNDLFSGKAKEKFIVKKSDKFIVVKPSLFDYLEFEFIANKTFKRKVTYSLFDQNKEGKFKPIIQNAKIKSNDYNALLRLIRF